MSHMQKYQPGEELEIGYTQQAPDPASPDAHQDHRCSDSPTAYAESGQLSPRSAILQYAATSHSAEQPRQRHHMLRSRASRVQPYAEPQSAPQQRQGSRLALSLGDLDIPQLLGERDLHAELQPSSPELELDAHSPRRRQVMNTDVQMTGPVQMSEESKDVDTSSNHSNSEAANGKSLPGMCSSVDAAVSQCEPQDLSQVADGLRFMLASSHGPDRLSNSLGESHDLPRPHSTLQPIKRCFSQQTVGGPSSPSHASGLSAMQQLHVPPVQTGCPMQVGQHHAQGLSTSLSPHALQVPYWP